MPDITFRAATWDDRALLARLLELYQYDLSDLWPQHLDAQGNYGYELDPYLRQADRSATLFLVDSHCAGFGLVSTQVCLPGNTLWMAQFFVMKAYRRLGVGRLGAWHLFDSHRGLWEVGQMPGNSAATAFWRRTIGQYTGGRFEEHVLADARWHGPLQCFDNRTGHAPGAPGEAPE